MKWCLEAGIHQIIRTALATEPSTHHVGKAPRNIPSPSELRTRWNDMGDTRGFQSSRWPGLLLSVGLASGCNHLLLHWSRSGDSSTSSYVTLPAYASTGAARRAPEIQHGWLKNFMLASREARRRGLQLGRHRINAHATAMHFLAITKFPNFRVPVLGTKNGPYSGRRRNVTQCLGRARVPKMGTRLQAGAKHLEHQTYVCCGA